MDKTKKIILTALGMALIAFFIGGGTYAYFSDVEKTHNTTFTAGTLNLSVENLTVPIGIDPLKPGDSNVSYVNWNLVNDGDIDGILNVSVSAITNDENALLEPEEDEGDSGPGGELGENLTVALWVDNGTNRMYLNPGSSTHLEWTSFNNQPDINYFSLNDFGGLDTTGSSTIGLHLPANSSDTIFNIAYDLPYETGNEVQSDSCSFNITFTLRQQPQ